MDEAVVTGNAAAEGQMDDRRGWFIGHFIEASTSLRCSAQVELKWGIHPRGEEKSMLAQNATATTLSVLISGAFRVEFPEQQRAALLLEPGDYVLFAPGVPHRWVALQDTVILTVRWPSLPGDQTALPW